MSDPLLHVATRKGLFRIHASGAILGHAPAFLGEPVTATLSDPRDGAIYAALRLGHFGVKLHRSDDGGARWQELPAPAFPAAPDAEKASAVDMIWTIAAGGRDKPGRLWAGTLPGGLFRSDDHGQSWALVESLWNVPERQRWFGGGYDHPGIHTIRVDAKDSDRLTVAVSCGGVWRSADGGASWRLVGTGMRAAYLPPDLADDRAVQDPHRLAFCDAQPDVVWCQHHDGLFRSTDGCESFTPITDVQPSGFGFAVAAHPQDPLTAWFVPAVKDECRVPAQGRFVVTRTRDGGRSFDVLDEGLPAGASYDLVYRHALEVDATGERLAMGSTTGHLWTSVDSGQRWSLIGANLPPIAQVSFA